MQNNILGTRLRECRKDKKLSIKEVAQIINLSTMALNHYEWGDREPPFDIFVKLCDLYETSADYLIGRTDIF